MRRGKASGFPSDGFCRAPDTGSKKIFFMGKFRKPHPHGRVLLATAGYVALWAAFAGFFALFLREVLSGWEAHSPLLVYAAGFGTDLRGEVSVFLSSANAFLVQFAYYPVLAGVICGGLFALTAWAVNRFVASGPAAGAGAVGCHNAVEPGAGKAACKVVFLPGAAVAAGLLPMFPFTFCFWPLMVLLMALGAGLWRACAKKGWRPALGRVLCLGLLTFLLREYAVLAFALYVSLDFALQREKPLACLRRSAAGGVALAAWGLAAVLCWLPYPFYPDKELFALLGPDASRLFRVPFLFFTPPKGALAFLSASLALLAASPWLRRIPVGGKRETGSRCPAKGLSLCAENLARRAEETGTAGCRSSGKGAKDAEGGFPGKTARKAQGGRLRHGNHQGLFWKMARKAQGSRRRTGSQQNFLGKTARRAVQAALLLFATGGFCLAPSASRPLSDFFACDRLCRENRWEEALRLLDDRYPLYAGETELTYGNILYGAEVKACLLATRKATDRIFTYSLPLFPLLFPSDISSRPEAYVLPHYYAFCGNFSESLHLNYDWITARIASPVVMREIVNVCLTVGDTLPASKFLYRMGKSLFRKGDARALLAPNAERDRAKAWLPPVNYAVRSQEPDLNAKTNFRYQPGNPYFLEYYLALCLMDKNAAEIAALYPEIREYYDTGRRPFHAPRHLQEALLSTFGYVASGLAYPRHLEGIGEDTWADYWQFLIDNSNYQNGQLPFFELQSRWKHTYWFYDWYMQKRVIGG